MARKKKHEPHVNHERWLVSYADFITLLFAFFVVLYGVSQVDSKKMGKLVQSMAIAFQAGMFDPGTNKLNLADGAMDPQIQAALMAPIVPNNASNPVFKRVRELIEAKLSEEKTLDRVRFQETKRGLVISMEEAGFFHVGEAEILPESQETLDTIAKAVMPLPNQIRIEGHTDNVPIHTARFPSNWELSTTRATAVIAYLTRKFSFEPTRLSAAGYAEFRPVAPNDTPEGRALNRRVDVVVLSEMAEGLEPKARELAIPIPGEPASTPITEPSAAGNTEATAQNPEPASSAVSGG